MQKLIPSSCSDDLSIGIIQVKLINWHATSLTAQWLNNFGAHGTESFLQDVDGCVYVPIFHKSAMRTDVSPSG